MCICVYVYMCICVYVYMCICTCWGGNNRAGDTLNLNRLVKKAGSVVGSALQGVEEVTKVRTARKLVSILENSSHPLYPEITKSWSERGNNCFVYPARRCERLGKSFVPAALKLYNETHCRRSERPSFVT